MPNELLLTGVPAFVGQVLGPTRVKFFVDENEFDPAKMIEIDLAKNPRVTPEALWATDVDCDHQMPGGLTTIGPTFHGDAKHVGSVYLSQRLVAKYSSVLASWPPTGDELYQYQLVLRAIPGEQRYHGFKVRIVGPAQASHVRVEFFRIGQGTPIGVPRLIDLADPSVCDPPANGFTTITPGSPGGTIGALFLSSRVVTADSPSHPKIPVGAGW